MNADGRMTDKVNQRWNTSQYSTQTDIETDRQTYKPTNRQTESILMAIFQVNQIDSVDSQSPALVLCQTFSLERS